jgi:hypothetical protein
MDDALVQKRPYNVEVYQLRQAESDVDGGGLTNHSQALLVRDAGSPGERQDRRDTECHGSNTGELQNVLEGT